MNEYGMMDNNSGEMLALRGVDVTTRIAGLLASTTLVQKYKNDTDTNLELSYTFPLPLSGTLLSFSVAIGERNYDGQVIPRTQAETKYEETISEGNSAFRLQQVRAGMYNATLGNVMPGENVAITLTYAEPLAWNGKSIRYRLPTTIAPRYGEPTGMQPWQRPETSLAAEYSLDVTVSITGDLARCAVTCPSHKVSMKTQPNALTIQVAKGASMDRDFILEVESDEIRSLGIFARARDTNVAMLTLLPPEEEQQGAPRDVVLVIDCSGSMQGDSMNLAQEGVQLALGSLTPNEHFGLIAFGTRFLKFDKELQPANRKNLDMARRWVYNLPNLGGTNIDGALELALQLRGKRPMDILLLTDGQDWQVGPSVGAAKTNGVRIFSMGIGSAVAADAVQMMADETGGACELVAPTEDMSERIYRHFNRMRQPQMDKLVIAWPSTPLWECRPSRAGFAGDAYTVFAALPEGVAEEATVRFEYAEQPPQSLTVALRKEDECPDAIVRLAAKQHIPALDIAERQFWAVHFQLITDETDYLVTVERAAGDKAEDLPELQTQPQMLPAGWGGTSRIFMSPVVPKSLELRSPARSEKLRSFLVSDASVDYSALEVPCLLRRSSVAATLGSVSSNGYVKFIETFNQLSSRKLLGKTPKTIHEFLKLPIPKPLDDLIAELTTQVTDQDQLIHSFYAALLKHSGSALLSEKLLARLHAFVRPELVSDDIVERIREVLDELWKQRYAKVDRYDIPAFLSNAAD